MPTIHLYHEAIMEPRNRTRFGVVIPAFNSASVIEATLDAVAAQVHAATAVIVVLDGPDPAIEEIVVRHSMSPEVLVLPENSGGPGLPRNVGADRLRAQHEIDAFWFLDADDLPSPEFLGVMNRVLDEHPNTAMVISEFTNWPDSVPPPDSQPVPVVIHSVEIELDWYLEHTGALLPSFSVIRAEAFDRLQSDAGGFRRELSNNQDYQLFVRLIAMAECRRTTWNGGAYRIHAASISSNKAKAWDCRSRADRMLANWFESRGSTEVSRRFIAKSSSAARRAAKETWHAGRRAEAVSRLLRRATVSLDPKAAVVLARLVLGVEGSSPNHGE